MFLLQSHCCEYLNVIKVMDLSSSSEIIEHKIEHTQEGVLKKSLWLGRLSTEEWQAQKEPLIANKASSQWFSFAGRSRLI